MGWHSGGRDVLRCINWQIVRLLIIKDINVCKFRSTVSVLYYVSVDFPHRELLFSRSFTLELFDYTALRSRVPSRFLISQPFHYTRLYFPSAGVEPSMFPHSFSKQEYHPAEPKRCSFWNAIRGSTANSVHNVRSHDMTPAGAGRISRSLFFPCFKWWLCEMFHLGKIPKRNFNHFRHYPSLRWIGSSAE